jgi:selenide,water dikinase
VGVFSAALKQDRLSASAYATMAASATQLNVVGAALSQIDGVHALTDVTGFGLLGHACEMAKGSGVDILLTSDQVPLWPGALELAQAGVRTGASRRNLESVRPSVRTPAELPSWTLDLLCDPQTSGGLLIAASPSASDAVLQIVRQAGFTHAAVIGLAQAGSGVVVLDAAAPL